MSRWYRAYAGTVRDDKLAECAVIAGCSRSIVIATWHAILESAAETADAGRFETSARRVAAILGEPLAVVEAVFAGMGEVGLIEGDTLPAWKRRQFESDNSTERSRKHRETRRNADATLQQRSATPPDTDTETDTEKKDDVGACVAAPEPIIEPKKRKREPKPSDDEAVLDALTDALMPETARAVMDHRKALRKPLTPMAARLLAKEILKLSAADWEAAAQTMIVNGWQGFRADWYLRSKEQEKRGGSWQQTRQH